MVSGFLLAGLVVGASVLVTLLGLRAVRRRLPHPLMSGHTEVAGYVFATLGVVYAVMLGLVVVAVWTEYEEARNAAEAEANALLDLFRLAEAWPDAERVPVEGALLAYARAVIDEEWPAMARGAAPSATAATRMDEIWDAYARLEQGPLRDTARYGESLTQLDALDDGRSLRILASQRGIPSVMWGVLVIGGVVTVAFGYLFSVENGVAHGTMLAMLATLIALLLFLVQALNLPFRDPVRLSPDGFQQMVLLAEGEGAATPELGRDLAAGDLLAPGSLPRPSRSSSPTLHR